MVLDLNRTIPILIALAVSSPFLAIALNAMGVGPGFHEEAPTWSSGHQWTYDAAFTGRARGVILGVAEAETEAVRVDGTRQFEVVHDAWNVDGLPFYAALQSFGVTKATYGGETVYDRNNPDSGEAPFGDDRDVDMFDGMLCLDRCATLLTPYTYEANPVLSATPFSDTRTGPEVLRFLDFPLKQGNVWTVIAVEEEEFQLEIRAEAVDKEYITLPGRDPVESIRIEAGLTDASRRNIQRLVEAEAASEEVSLSLDLDLDFTYWYAPLIEQIVRFEARSFVAGQGAGYGAAGAFRIDMGFTETLRDYSLGVTDNRDPEAMQQLAHGLRNANRAGSALSSEPVLFTAVANKMHVDSTRGETVTLGIGPHHVDDERPPSEFITAPPGSSIAWTHSFPTETGRLEKRNYEGDSVEIPINQPGIQTITATMTDSEGRLQGIDIIQLDGYQYTKITPHTDALPALVGSNGATQTFWIAPGAVTAVFQAEGDATTLGTLTVVSPYGEQESSGPGDIELQYPQPFNGNWQVTWEQDTLSTRVDIISEIHYTVDQNEHTFNSGDASSNLPSAFDMIRLPGGLLRR